ncbi:MAG TPA: class I SAM-dependent methyltransferase [Draconibacterium sp.]|nr:class I SAM-dependent methyltransferase [Draconibacterium sp.]
MGLRTKIRRYRAAKQYPMEIYVPTNKKKPERILQIVSAWEGLEMIIEDILDRFDIGREKCIEFGTEYGYSTVIFSNYFKQVKGIDLFIGDEHSGLKIDHFEETKSSVKQFKNIELIRSDYKDYIKKDSEYYDLAHVDIVHTYKQTYECGLWAAKHSKCCIFHDTESFSEVRNAVFDVAKFTGKKVYNYPYYNGLGIIVG